MHIGFAIALVAPHLLVGRRLSPSIDLQSSLTTPKNSHTTVDLQSNSTDSNDSTITFDQFVDLAKSVAWNLTDIGAMKRVFQGMNTSVGALSKNALVRGAALGLHKDFVNEMVRALHAQHAGCKDECPKVSTFLSQKGKNYPNVPAIGICWTQCFQIPADYDWDSETRKNYAWQGNGMAVYTGPYAGVRDTRNKSYHGDYSPYRMAWQDEWVNRVVMRAPFQIERPWLVYTAGGMAVGKGRVMNWLTDNGFLGTENFVYINPDYFKLRCPEYAIYKQQGYEEGTMTHRESGYMQELALWGALSRSSNIIEDGSLRDTKWYAGKLDDAKPFKGIVKIIRDEFPQYRIAILHVDLFLEAEAKKNVILARLAKRAQEERSTPIDKALKSYTQSLATVEKLVADQNVDFVAHIDNTQAEPRLVRVAKNAGRWEDVPETPRGGSPFAIVGEMLGPGTTLGQTEPPTSEAANIRMANAQRMVDHFWPTAMQSLLKVESFGASVKLSGLSCLCFAANLLYSLWHIA